MANTTDSSKVVYDRRRKERGGGQRAHVTSNRMGKGRRLATSIGYQLRPCARSNLASEWKKFLEKFFLEKNWPVSFEFWIFSTNFSWKRRVTDRGGKRKEFYFPRRTAGRWNEKEFYTITIISIPRLERRLPFSLSLEWSPAPSGRNFGH